MDEMTQINQIWKNTHGVKPQEGRELLLVCKKKKTYYHFGLYNSGNDRVMITSPTGFPWRPFTNFTNFDLWAYLDELLDISNQQEPANEQTLANSAKSCKDLQESTSEDLEKAARHYLLNEHASPLNAIMHEADLKAEMQYHKDIENAFKAGTQWQKERDQKELQIAEEHGILTGMNMEREKLMKDAIDGEIVLGGNDEKVVRHPTRWMASHDTPLPRHIIDKYHIGDKVKLIIFPSDNEYNIYRMKRRFKIYVSSCPIKKRGCWGCPYYEGYNSWEGTVDCVYKDKRDNK